MARPQAGPEFGYNFDFSLCPLVIWWMNMVQTLTSHVVSAVVLLKVAVTGFPRLCNGVLRQAITRVVMVIVGHQ